MVVVIIIVTVSIFAMPRILNVS